MRIEQGIKLDFKDVLIRPKRSTLGSRAEVDLVRTFRFPHASRLFNGVPIIASNMDGVGTMAMARAFHAEGHGFTVALHKYYGSEELAAFFATPAGAVAWYTTGISDDDETKLDALIGDTGDGAGLEKICIDVANGYQSRFVAFVEEARARLPDAIIMAGNVVTGEMVEELVLAGADIVKLGIGPGSVCTTREVTGVGYPQLSAIIECADAAHGLKGLVCADGGCRTVSDIAKAFGAGADFVMLGGMLAGHDESEQEILHTPDGDRVEFYGSSSDTAMQRHEKRESHRASEGKTVYLPYKGGVANTVDHILGGLRSTCTYVGALTLKELSKRTTFIRIA